MRRGDKFRCQVRWYEGNSKKRKSKSKTFSKKSAAKAWGKLKVEELEDMLSKGLETLSLDNPIQTLRDLITAYLNDTYIEARRSKRSSLKAVIKCNRVTYLKRKNIKISELKNLT